MAQLVGRVRIVINGRTYNSKPGAKCDPGGITRSSVTGDTGVDNVGALRPAKIEAEFHWQKGISLKALNDLSGATVQFIGDTGDTLILNDAFRTGDLMGTSGDSGGIPVMIEAASSSEVNGA